VGVQLYGTHPNQKLIQHIESLGATALPVAPYVYADDAQEQQVVNFIQSLCDDGIDAIAFTSSSQVNRLLQVALVHDRMEPLRTRLNEMVVAAVGPVIQNTLQGYGIHTRVMPEESWFMKPLVRALITALNE
jgi:uroporphyrinogen-III synthase